MHITQPTLVVDFLIVACAYHLIIWSVYCLHCPWPKHNGQPMSSCLPTSLFAYAQWSNDVKRDLSALPLYYTQWSTEGGLLTLPLTFTKRSADVGCGLSKLPAACTSVYRSRTWTDNIIRILDRSIDVKRGLSASFVAFTHRSSNVGCGLQPSSVACTHQSTNAIQWQAESPKVCMHLTWYIRIWKATLTNGMRL